jgi:hypothetical protein
MRLRDLKLCVFAFAALLLGAAPTYAVGILPGSTTDIVTGQNYSYSPFPPLVANASINDTFSFNAGGMNAMTTAIALNPDPTTQGPFGVANLTIAWFNSALDPIGTLAVTDGLGVVSNPGASLFLALTGGLYHVVVTGTVLSGGGFYNLNVATTPLPPALILFGTALAGLTWLGRRRRASTAGH